jgi:cbb3-type cytochrome oxidase subunit 3
MKISHVIAHTLLMTIFFWVVIYFAGDIFNYEPMNIQRSVWILVPILVFLFVLFIHLRNENKED